ncbi:N-acetyltransferase family protein [Sphingopyxis sp. R3-92]|uniref:GNAT family N-acetyltransferase n=1 Tax=Sphingopyxis sp. R3-92 TaxID=3158553 RepID=UPI003EE71E06
MTYEIVPATEALLVEVEVWLDVEEAAHKAGEEAYIANGYEGDVPPRGFRCNWDTTKKFWREQGGGIDILVVDGEAVGFQGHGLFEIRPDLRRKGYGRFLAEFMIARAYDEGWSVFEIGIAPWTAEPFWQSMGFTLVPDRPDRGGGTFAYRVLPRRFELGSGERVPFHVEFFTSDERYSSEPRPFATFSGMGERLSDDSIRLPERVYAFDPLEDVSLNAFVRVEVDGEEIHFEKLKRDSSRAIGLECDGAYTYFMDKIRPR